MMLELIGYTLAPLTLGMFIRAWFSVLPISSRADLQRILYLMLFVLILGVVSSYQEIIDHFATVGALVITMNCCRWAWAMGSPDW